MNFKNWILCLAVAGLMFLTVNSNAQTRTVGLMENDSTSWNGYTLFSSLFSNGIYLIDNCGKVVNTWGDTLTPGNSVYLLPDGSLMRCAKVSSQSNPYFTKGGVGERVQKLDWDNNLLWDYVYSDTTYRMHHDIAMLPNGNVLILAWDSRTFDESVAEGRNPALIPDSVVWGEKIVEVQPIGADSGVIIWEWSIWDHLVQDFDTSKANYGSVKDREELLDVNVTGASTLNGGADWIHANAIDYNATFDQIVITSNYLSEIYVIDHSTTTAEAAGHSGGTSGKGGDILYRWGNPQNYRQGDSTDQKLFRPHDAHWIPGGRTDAGKIMIFNNGVDRPGGSHSSVDIIDPPIDEYISGAYQYIPGTAFAPINTDWSYSAPNPSDFYASFISGAQRLKNGNTLICDGAGGNFFEIDENENIVWEYESPATHMGIVAQGDTIPAQGTRNGNAVFRCTRYDESFAGFQGKDLTPGDPLELNPFTDSCEIHVNPTTGIRENHYNELSLFPNPADQYLNLRFDPTSTGYIQISDLFGRLIFEEKVSKNESELRLDVSNWSEGIYILKLNNQNIRKFLIVK